MTNRFEHQWVLYFLWLLPVLLAWRFYLLWWARNQRNVFARGSALLRLAPQADRFKSWVKFFLRFIALTALIIASANPQVGGQVENKRAMGAQVVFALDVSRSMLVEDVRPNRLQRAKQLVSRSISNMPNDQVGLIVFAGKSFPLVPLTPDKTSLLMQLRQADPGSISAQGTNFSHMIDLATTIFDLSIPSDRILFVIGDGEDHDGQWRNRVKKLQEMDVRIFTIGIGTEKGGLIPDRRSTGIIQDYIKDETGSAVVSRLEPSTLRELADFGAGDFHLLTSLNGGEQFIADVMLSAGRSEYEKKVYTTYQSQYHWPLTIALFLLLIEWLVFEKKTRWIQRLQSLREKPNEHE